MVAHTNVTSLSYLQADYPFVFNGVVKIMEGKLFHIALTEDAKPFYVHTLCNILYAFCDELKAKLQLLQEKSSIVLVTETTKWYAPIVVAPKKGNNKIRMCVDLSHLNKYFRRKRYQCPTPAQALGDTATGNVKVSQNSMPSRDTTSVHSM